MKEIKIWFFSDIFNVQKLSWISLIAVLWKSLKHALSRHGTPKRNAWSARTFYGLCKRHHKCTNSRCGCLFNQKGRGQMHLWNEMDLPNRRPQAEIGLHWVICKLLATRREEESVRNVILPVLLVNVGPETFENLSDICQKSVKKLSVTKMSQKTILNVSEFCQKTVRCKYLSEIYQKRFGNPSEMCQIL